MKGLKTLGHMSSYHIMCPSMHETSEIDFLSLSPPLEECAFLLLHLYKEAAPSLVGSLTGILAYVLCSLSLSLTCSVTCSLALESYPLSQGERHLVHTRLP